eukprot:TRINITY_DN32732_c0_g2_i1.p1 TRINITY_DN32732_c0_g2~~TRINITY_DN32732_c0_g2_i1.p1  ORF type:complete len:386 (+),score=93.18 TRINITY_DN32732_c0_g2_i1:126-1160(+)
MQNWRALLFAPPEVRSDKECILAAMPQSAEVLKCASTALRSDPAFLRDCFKVHGDALEFSSDEAKSHRDLVREAVRQNPRSLRFASPALRADPELVLEAVRGGQPWTSSGCSALQCAIHELDADAEVVRGAMHALDPAVWTTKVARDWRRLNEAPFEVRSNKDIVVQALRDSFGLALVMADVSLHADREVVLEAVRWCGEMLEYASEELRADREVVIEAVQQDWKALRFASEALRGDREVMLLCLKDSGDALQYAAGNLVYDRGLALQAVKTDGSVIKHLDKSLQDDPEVVMEAVKENWVNLRHVSGKLLERDEAEDPASPVMGAAFGSVETRRIWGRGGDFRD